MSNYSSENTAISICIVTIAIILSRDVSVPFPDISVKLPYTFYITLSCLVPLIPS